MQNDLFLARNIFLYYETLYGEKRLQNKLTNIMLAVCAGVPWNCVKNVWVIFSLFQNETGHKDNR